MAGTNRLICILGMHRSGTSCVTGSLQQAGLYLGNCHTWNPHNKKGNRENQDFVDLNDAVLVANNGAWDNPPRRPKWNSEQLACARTLLEDNFTGKPLGFKDPRTLLVVEGWKKAFPEIQFVGVVRHPNAVVGSLQKRSDMPAGQALALWYAYNHILLREYRKKPFPILCFDEDEALFYQKLDQVVGQLCLDKEMNDQRFYDGQLRTSNRNLQQMERELPWKVKRLYSRLLKRCL